MSVGEVMNREERPAYVRFERRPVEDVKASLAQGRYVAKDIDFAIVTPAYSKDAVEFKATTWLNNIEQNLKTERIPIKWAELWREAYTRWKNGQEMPLQGTPIKGWGLLSPAQQEMMIHMNVLTVEDLANINEEGARRIGMGSMELKNKAQNWLKTLNDSGKLALEITALQTENKILKETLANQQTQIDRLAKGQAQPMTIANMPPVEQINIDDILEDEEPIKKGPGRSKKE